jgi:hypothetical protein
MISIADSTAPVSSTPATHRIALFLRSASLAVVVLWHWVFPTVRWDANGPHTGNPLHLVPAGFLLTWCFQVMPVFFLVGGWASHGSLDRALAGGTRPSTWVRSRLHRLIVPVIPLVVTLLAIRIFASQWLFGVAVLAVSPLWFLAVYIPLTALTPLLRRTHQRTPGFTIASLLTGVAGIQYLRFVRKENGLILTIASFLFVWGAIYVIGFSLERVLRNRVNAAAIAIIGVLGIATGHLLGGYSLSMVTTAADTRSNMGPPTSQIVFLGLFQLGMIGLFANRIGRLTTRPTVAKVATWISDRQMSLYALHFPIWVATLLALRETRLAAPSTASLNWVMTRPLWAAVPFALMIGVLRVKTFKSARPRQLRLRSAG